MAVDTGTRRKSYLSLLLQPTSFSDDIESGNIHSNKSVRCTRSKMAHCGLGLMFTFLVAFCFFMFGPRGAHTSIERVLSSSTSCWEETWEDCLCDDISCGDDGHDAACIGSCDAKLQSAQCRIASDKCVQYDSRYCGSWCSDQRFQVSSFECSKCRSEECEPFCHGVPSVCKFDMCPASAELCGDSWALTCRSENNGAINEEVTQKVLGDTDTGFITEMSLTAALSKYNDMLKMEGLSCDCNEMEDDECMEADLCVAVKELNEGSTVVMDRMSSWDSRCCAYCTMVDPSGICAGAVAHYTSALTRALKDKTEM